MPKLLNIIINPNPILRKKSKEINPDKIRNKDYVALCADMAYTMLKKDGAGIAAPQVGKNIRLICINTDQGPVAMHNPKITKRSFLKEWGEEGCLSVPEVFGAVKRNKKIKCQYIDQNCKSITVEATDMMARVIQHEVDHLDGILFIDKAKDLQKIKNR